MGFEGCVGESPHHLFWSANKTPGRKKKKKKTLDAGGGRGGGHRVRVDSERGNGSSGSINSNSSSCSSSSKRGAETVAGAVERVGATAPVALLAETKLKGAGHRDVFQSRQ